MKTLLVLASHPELPDSIRSMLNPADYRVLHRSDVEEAEPLLRDPLLDVCIVDVESTDVQMLWALEKLKRLLPHRPVLLYTGQTSWEWEEEAYLQGIAQILRKPVRTRLLTTVLERLVKPPAEVVPMAPSRPPRSPRAYDESSPSGTAAGAAALQISRSFSTVLSQSLSAQGLLRQFLLFLRETLGVNRAAIFLSRSRTTGGKTRLHAACATSIPPGLLDHFELSFETGIGACLYRTGRILKRDSREASEDEAAQKEFELLGAEVAVPMYDREDLIGVAVFDGRLTGEPLSNPELELIFHLLEQVALAVRNIWLHDQVVANHEVLADVLREISSACVVVDRDLHVLHANKAARTLFARKPKRQGDFEFTDLPTPLGSKVYQVIKTGTGLGRFKYEPADDGQRVYEVTIAPFHQGTSALLVVEDQTQQTYLHKLELEAGSLRLVRSMADRMAHEIGNALVPIVTYLQFLRERWKDPEFRSSLESALGESVKRIGRLTNQMRFLARDTLVNQEKLAVSEVLEEAFKDAQKHHTQHEGQLKVDKRDQPLFVTGDRVALRHAFSEVLLNALQANPGDPKVEVRTYAAEATNGSHLMHIDIQDTGTGFVPEAVEKLGQAFFTTRNVGLGLGLAVARKILDTHHGKVQVVPNAAGQLSIVRITLPIDLTAPEKKSSAA